MRTEKTNFSVGIRMPGKTINAGCRAFEQAYIQTRQKEQRVFPVPEIRKLPKVKRSYIHAAEWEMRRRSIQRFTRYLKKQPPVEIILDVGCGNGFFTNILSRYAEKIVGVDINLTELKLAEQAFEDNPKLEWRYVDIFEEAVFPAGTFDLITFCCSFQYFENVERTIERVLQLLKPGGFIHIIDSPFYADEEACRQAKEQTIQYYNRINAATMSNYYFHHCLKDLMPYEPVIHIQRKTRMNRLFGVKNSPFPWIEIRKDN